MREKKSEPQYPLKGKREKLGRGFGRYFPERSGMDPVRQKKEKQDDQAWGGNQEMIIR